MQFQNLDSANFILDCILRYNSQLATPNFNIKTCNSKFHWNLQLLTSHSLFRDIHRSTANLSTVGAHRIFMVFSNSGVTISLNKLNVIWQDSARYWSSSQLSFIVLMVICFFFLCHFLVVEDYELFQSIVIFYMEYIRVLVHLFFFLH